MDFLSLNRNRSRDPSCPLVDGDRRFYLAIHPTHPGAYLQLQHQQTLALENPCRHGQHPRTIPTDFPSHLLNFQ